MVLVSFDSAWAVPASPEGVEVVQPDGTRFQLHLRGDEYFSWRETSDGYVVVKDGADGFWKYAQPGTNRAEFHALRAARVGSSDPVRLGLGKHALPEGKLLRAHTLDRQRAVSGAPVSSVTSPAPSAAPLPAANQSEAPPVETQPDDPPARVPVSGIASVKNIVILACFSNHWDSVNNTVVSAYGHVAVNEYSNLFNQVGYATDGAVGSVKDYYQEVSYGRLTIQSVITVWVRLPRGESYYHDNQGVLAADAIAAADAAGFDFSQGDTDGDGWVDCLDVIHSGYGEEATGDTNNVWSVKGSLSSVTTIDGVKMKPYHTEPALRGSSGSGIIRIGVICHETGHFFGLPDLYDTSYLTDGLGDWCLMSGGSWNGADGRSPAHFSAWCKVFLGFARPVQIHSQTGVVLPRFEDNAMVGMLRDGMSNGEYFLVEHRAKVGFDNTSQIYPGLIVYHVYSDSPGNNSSAHPHPRVRLEEADGNDSLGLKTAASEAGDVWTSTSGLAGGFRDQTGSANTSAMLYQAGVFSARAADASSYSYNRLTGFSAAGSNISFNAQTLKTTAPAQFALPPNYAVSWAACSEATKYEIQEGSKVTLTSFFDGAEDEAAMYDNWHLAGGTQRISTNGYAGTCSYAMLSGKASVHVLTLRKPFKAGVGTLISFRLMSHIASGSGYLKFQVSKDGGNTWNTLRSYNDYLDPWTPATFNFAALAAQGINVGDSCLIRFVADIEAASGWSSYPRFGFALDDIAISGTEIDGYGSWTTLDNNLAATSYGLTGRTSGVHVYRVQAYANGAWQGYGTEGETIVGPNHAPAFASSPVAGADANIGTAYSGTLASLGTDLDSNDMLVYAKLNGPAWLKVAANGAFSGTPVPTDLGTNTFTVRVTDLAGASADAQLVVVVGLPASGLRSNLVAYLPFDADYLDYSGRNNHPGVASANSRATGFLGGGSYALSSAGYLSLGTGPDFHVSTSTSDINTNSFSVSFWAKLPPGAYTGEPVFVANKDWSSDNNTGWALAAGPGTSSSGYWQVNFKESNANARNFDSTSSVLANGGWHHFLVAAQCTGTRTLLTYIDGVQADSRTLFTSGTALDLADLPLNIGQDGAGAGTRGIWTGGTAALDDFALWRRALSPGEVAAIYSAGTNGFSLAYAEAAPVITNVSPGMFLPVGNTLSLAVGVLSAATPAYQWWLNGAPISGATNATYSKASPTQADLGAYEVAVTNLYGTALSSPMLITNRPPVAGLMTVSRTAGMTLKIAFSELAAHWSDPDGDAVKLTAINLLTTNGVTLGLVNAATNSDGSYVITAGAYLGYTNHLNVNDQVSYTIADGFGGTAAGYLNLGISTNLITGQMTGIVAPGRSAITLNFAGVPGYPYSLQRSTNLIGWTTIWTTNAPSGGVFDFTDGFENLDAPPASAYYRLTWTP